MIVLCEKCGTKYVVDDALLGRKFCTLKCAYCDHSWIYEKYNNEGNSFDVTNEIMKSKTHSDANDNFFNEQDDKRVVANKSDCIVNLVHDNVIDNDSTGTSFFSKMFKTQSKVWYIFLFLTIIVGTFMSIIALRNTNYETFGELYKLFNIFNVKNISLKNVAYQVFKDGDQVNLLLSVDIVNESTEQNIVPDLYVLLLDKDNKILKKIFFKSNNRDIYANSSYKFATKISQVPMNLSRLVVNIVDPVDFLFLNKAD